jgi:Icc-related predicted phosphoesterase
METKQTHWRRWRYLLLLPIAAAVVICFTTFGHHAIASQPAAELQQTVTLPFRFVAFGDTRFTHSDSKSVSNGEIRRAIVASIAKENPAFISIGGDIVYRGDDPGDWAVWDEETKAWKQQNFTVYPALGNHDLHGNESKALANYFQRFPELNSSRYYSARLANCLMLVLDSMQPETSGPQGEWLKHKLAAIPEDVAFVIVVLHHPPYTSSSDAEKYGGGHSSRAGEHELARWLEEQQQRRHARFVVFAGHVHNYERHEHNGVMYFVTGGGGAHAYPIERSRADLFQSTTINYNYLLAEVSAESMKVTMKRVETDNGKEVWTEPDSVTIRVPDGKTQAIGR